MKFMMKKKVNLVFIKDKYFGTHEFKSVILVQIVLKI